VGNAPLSPAISDVNNDGLPDILVTTHSDWENPDAKNEVSVLTNLGNTVFSQAKYEVGSDPSHAQAVFLNNDEYPDIVTSNRGTNNISVLINNGDGTFLPQVTYSAGNSPNLPALSDVNNDGHPDLCITNQGSADLWVLTNNGEGAFNDHQVYQVGEKPRICTPAYCFDNDYPSLFVSYKDGIAVFHNKKDGTFYDKVFYQTQYKDPVQVQISDVNKDGFTDMMTSTNQGGGSSKSEISVLLNNGDGTFAPEIRYSLALTSGNSAIPDLDFAIGDLTGDDFPDVVVYNLGMKGCNNRNVVILKNMGDGTFKIDKPYEVGDEPSFIAMGNVNKDNCIDLIITNQGSNDISLLLNHGDGTFQSEERINVTCDFFPLICKDVSGDGIPDLLASSGSPSLSVLINNGDGTFGLETLYTKITNVTEGVCNDMVVDDVDNDGYNDILWLTKNELGMDPGGPKNFGLSVFMNKGNGTFGDEIYYQLNGTTLNSRHLITADLDKDGFSDVVISNKGTNNISELLNKGDGTFKNEITYSTGFSPDTLLASDLNNDGYYDVITLNNSASTVGNNNLSILINKKDGTFEQSTEYEVGSGPEILKIADLNNDGWIDLVVGNYNSTDISVLINNDDGTYKLQEKYVIGHSQKSIEIADCNNDGFKDIIIAAGGNSTEVLVFNNRKDGTFTMTSIDVSEKIWGLVAGDIDNDGNVDIIASLLTSGGFGAIDCRVCLILGKEDGSFMTPIYWYSMGNFQYFTFLDDINNDNLLDILIGHGWSKDVAIHFNTGYSYK
ncbi:VCBS repeat-containing protein, partial [bacterium]|nr:VCBS repeat-containing protein [bacterium]